NERGDGPRTSEKRDFRKPKLPRGETADGRSSEPTENRDCQDADAAEHRNALYRFMEVSGYGRLGLRPSRGFGVRKSRFRKLRRFATLGFRQLSIPCTVSLRRQPYPTRLVALRRQRLDAVHVDERVIELEERDHHRREVDLIGGEHRRRG